MIVNKKPILNVVLAVAVLLMVIPAAGCDSKYTPGEQDIKVTQGLPNEFLMLGQAWQLLQKNFVDRSKLDPLKMAQGAIRGMVEATGDPYTEYYTPQSYQSTMVELTGVYQGIGAYIGKKDNRIVIIAPMKGSPAEQAGLKSGDAILKIDGESTELMNSDDASTRIRGKVGTKVALVIGRQGATGPLEISVERKEIRVDSVTSEVRGQVAVIKIQQFILPTTSDFKQALQAAFAQGAKGVILDLRNNPGGILDQAVEVSSQFLLRGIVVKVVDKDGNESVQKVRPGGIATNVPVIVLMNEGSASASEIVAGALQDNQRAKLAGTKSFGKASVQNIVKMNDGSAIKITTAHYFTPNGQMISGKGLTPDYPSDLKDDELVKWAEDYLNKIIAEQPAEAK
jgi:carboxyl-terminal processing protease